MSTRFILQSISKYTPRQFINTTTTPSFIQAGTFIRLNSTISSNSIMAPPTTTATVKPKTKGDAIAKGDPITKPSLSASLVIIAPLSTKTVDGYNYRTLLLKRNAKSSTFQSAAVFPGGNMDPIDTNILAWSRFFPDLNEFGKKLSEEEVKMLCLKICAVRETFEESGILLIEESDLVNRGRGEKVWEGVSEKERLEWRDKVHSNGAAFVDLFKLLSVKNPNSPSRPAISSLQYRANWITPKNMKRRFDTHFFVTVLKALPSSVSSSTSAPIISEPIASADGKETVSSDWLTPSEAIRRTMLHTKALTQGLSTAEDGSLILFPPQYYLLAEFTRNKNYQDLLDLNTRDGNGNPLIRSRPIASFGPEMRQVLALNGEKRSATVLPGDPEHSATVELGNVGLAKGALHRTYVMLPRPGGQLGLTVMGIVRQGLTGWLGNEWGDMKEGDTGEVVLKVEKL